MKGSLAPLVIILDPPEPVVISNNDSVVVGDTFSFEFQRQHVLRCSHNFNSTQLEQMGSPVITSWYFQTLMFSPNVNTFGQSILAHLHRGIYNKCIELKVIIYYDHCGFVMQVIAGLLCQ